MSNEKIVFQIRKMNNLRRSNDMPVATNTVAQHSYHVALLAMMISRDFINQGYNVDEATVMRKALMHDVGEIVVGDILYPVKKRLGSVVDEMEEEGLRNLFAGSDFESLVDDAVACKSGFTGQIVDLADMLEYVMNMYEEIQKGNKQMVVKYDEALRVLRGMPRYSLCPFVQSIVDAMGRGYCDASQLI